MAITATYTRSFTDRTKALILPELLPRWLPLQICPGQTKKKLIGFLGGMDAPVINDFLVGYIEGAKSIDPEIKVAVSYVESYSDPAKGKEMCLAQYDMGVDIGFNVAVEAVWGSLTQPKKEVFMPSE